MRGVDAAKFNEHSVTQESGIGQRLADLLDHDKRAQVGVGTVAQWISIRPAWRPRSRDRKTST